MITFQRGQKSPISQITPETRLQLFVNLSNPQGLSLDVGCFGLDESGKLLGDDWFIFYNQLQTPCGAVSMENLDVGEARFSIDLGRLDPRVKRLMFTASIDGPGQMSALAGSEWVLSAGGQELMSFPFDGQLFQQEKAVMIGEVYLKSVWRIAAIAQGFAGGLRALLEHFGGEALEDDPAPPAPAPAPPAPAPAPRQPTPSPPPAPPRQPTPPPPPSAPLNLGKITLSKRGDSQKISLKKGASNTIHINLNWENQTVKRSFWRSATSADLDLGCMYLLKNGQKGVIQPLGNNFGARDHEPYILLDKDDRSGSSDDGENMHVFRPDLIERIVVFAMIYEGAKNFTEVNGRVTVKDDHGNEITVHCDAPDSSQTFCAVVLIENEGGELKYTKEERYFASHRPCDEHYGFGFRWVAGHK